MKRGIAALLVSAGLALGTAAGYTLSKNDDIAGHNHADKVLHFDCQGCSAVFTGGVQSVLKASIAPRGSQS